MRLHRHLKHWFVPHQHNDHRPHLIRAHGLALTVALLIAVQFTAAALVPVSAKGSVSRGAVLAYATSSITPIDLFNQTNQQRIANGLPALHLDARLNTSAGMKAQNMFAEDYWAHVSPSGIQPWYWFTQAGYTYRYAGENLAKDFDTTAGVMDGWMNSPGHRANILNPNYTDVGFAVENGTLVGGQTTLVVAHYGALAGAPAPVVVAATPRPTPRPTVAPAVPVAATVPTTTPTPTPTPVPTASPVVAVGSVSQSAPDPARYTPIRPLAVTRTLGWGQLASLGLLAALFFVYAWTHLVVWRRGLRRWNTLRYRGWAMAQVGGLALVMVYFATSGFGRVG